MNLPSLPTDSLYKFLAITGLLLTGIGYYAPKVKMFDLQKEEMELNQEIDVFNLEINLEKEKFKDFEKEIKRFNKENNTNLIFTLKDSLFVFQTPISGHSKTALQANLIKDFVDKYKLNSIEWRKKDLLLNYKKRLVNQKVLEYNELEKISISSFFIGLIITTIGFVLWYYKIQNHQDEILERNNQETSKKEKICQSCGMSLKYDLHPYIEAEFCSSCYDGEKFKEPDLTLLEMENKIKKRMQEQGLSNDTIKKQLATLKTLNRWSQIFKW